MKNIFSFQKQKGFTMIEAIISTFILMVAIIGCYLVFFEISSTTAVISYRLTAAYLAQEGIEIIRNIRDTNWLIGKNWSDSIDGSPCSSGCEADYTTQAEKKGFELRPYGTSGNYLNLEDESGFYGYSGGIPTKFKRKITVIHPDSDPNILKVSVLMEWEDKKNTYNFLTETYLYNWKE